MREDAIRAKLQRFILDGSEALEAIRFLLTSPDRPSDVMKPIGKILQRHYRDCVHIDAVVDLLNGDDP
jgi:hypothetical protein